MGESENAKTCKILNPEVIDFSTEKTLLKATTDKFLIIENVSLGYRVKYLLRNFQYNKELETTIYDGECIFEDMGGTPEQKVKWILNRRKTYEGSLMHYLRAVHQGKSRDEGFLTYAITSLNFPLVIDPNPIVMEQIIQHTDNNFYTFKYKKRLYTLYDKKKASAKDKYSDQREVLEYLHKTGSVLQLNADIDRRESTNIIKIF